MRLCGPGQHIPFGGSSQTKPSGRVKSFRSNPVFPRQTTDGCSFHRLFEVGNGVEKAEVLDTLSHGIILGRHDSLSDAYFAVQGWAEIMKGSLGGD